MIYVNLPPAEDSHEISGLIFASLYKSNKIRKMLLVTVNCVCVTTSISFLKKHGLL